jgi:hypothetical protein
MTLSMRFALKADSNCSKFSSIGGKAICAIPLDAHLMTGSDALASGKAVPVAVFLVLNLWKDSNFCAIISIASPRVYQKGANPPLWAIANLMGVDCE